MQNKCAEIRIRCIDGSIKKGAEAPLEVFKLKCF
jgi:hypothetical protein